MISCLFEFISAFYCKSDAKQDSYITLTVMHSIVIFGGVFVALRCFLDFSVGVEVFVIGLSQIG